MSKRRLLKTVLPIVAVLALACGASAYFATSGSGSGSGSVSVNEQPVTLSAATPSTQLYPGGQADVALSVSNPNSGSTHIGSFALDSSQGTSGFSVDSGHSGCSLSALQFTSQTNGGAGWTVPAKTGSVNGSLSIDLASAVSMSTSAANACQGASYTVYLKVGS
jgi:hypothetical protein